MDLIAVDGGTIRAKTEVMNQFIAPRLEIDVPGDQVAEESSDQPPLL